MVCRGDERFLPIVNKKRLSPLRRWEESLNLSRKNFRGEKKMDLGENKTGLIPVDFKAKNQEAIIRGKITEKTKKSRKGVDYQTFSFMVEIDGKLFQLSNLMRNQLNGLVDAFGSETASWDGKKIYIEAEQKGEFHNFVLCSQAIVSEETIN